MKSSHKDVKNLFNKMTAGILTTSGELLPSAGTKELLELLVSISFLQYSKTSAIIYYNKKKSRKTYEVHILENRKKGLC